LSFSLNQRGTIVEVIEEPNGNYKDLDEVKNEILKRDKTLDINTIKFT